MFGSGSWFSCSIRSGSGSEAEKDPNKFGSVSHLNFSHFLEITAFTLVKIVFLGLKFSSQQTFNTVFMYSKTKNVFLNIAKLGFTS